MPPHEKQREFVVYNCGCYFDRTVGPNGDTISLKMQICDMCYDMSMQWFDMEVARQNAQLTLELASEARAETVQ